MGSSESHTKLASAVAVDLGATSVRFALGTFDGNTINYRIVDQRPNIPIEHHGKPCWDFEALLGFGREACALAKTENATVGIDSWGVDHGHFLPGHGKLLAPPVCYRDPRHEEIFNRLASYRHRLYELTGVAHQPFNTLYQLAARREEHPEWVENGANWLILPDLLNCGLCGAWNYELTQASTTQLMGIDGAWCPEAFAIAGWPIPEHSPTPPGGVVGNSSAGVAIVSVGSHDTASAVLGLGTLESDEVFLNVGTWSLLGCILDRPLATLEAEAANFSNEWTVDGRVRFLKNIPGFYIINRLFEELGISGTVPEWIARADQSYGERIDPLKPEFFNPPSMQVAVRAQLKGDPPTLEAWGGIALMSLADTTADQLHSLENLVNRRFSKIRLAGGGSNSRAFCEALANVTGRAVLAGPSEATVLGNLGAQFLAQGHFSDWGQLGDFLRGAHDITTYHPSE